MPSVILITLDLALKLEIALLSIMLHLFHKQIRIEYSDGQWLPGEENGVNRLAKHRRFHSFFRHRSWKDCRMNGI
jgi:hypothetical protein